ncbi:MAG TPA: aminotransferase class I/II-fold pyridoxal phosphate-dependent enzyme [Chitinophagales bacterium]|nr:aminotransferase class I/II-fold pyridoxal phosphate-dependent enzyme [Chitinophagales bacterium]
MTATGMATQHKFKVSAMAENLIGSEIIKLANEINAKIKKGEQIYNLTIGDFDPHVFPIPSILEQEIIEAYRQKETNYPMANGIERLRVAASGFIKKYQSLDYSPDEFLISGGARPLIYGVFRTLLDTGDKVIYPGPSWNNNHYTHLAGANGVFIETTPEDNFMPTAENLKPHLKGATLLALCSPLNPTGTTFSKEALSAICDLVIEENNSREENAKPLYILYDQIYWMLTNGDTKHYDPVSLRPELRDYVIYVDGISKAFSATGVRVGWAFGPKPIIDKMRSIISHIGAWSPKAEQVATAKFLQMEDEVDAFIIKFRRQISDRLNGFYAGFSRLKQKGFPVECIPPEAAIYLTVRIDFRGAKTADGNTINTMADVADYLLNEARIGLVPFYAFGSSKESPWFRLSIGTCTMDAVSGSLESLDQALSKLTF